MNQDSLRIVRPPACRVPYRSQRTTASSFTTPYEQTFTSSEVPQPRDGVSVSFTQSCIKGDAHLTNLSGHQTSMAVTSKQTSISTFILTLIFDLAVLEAVDLPMSNFRPKIFTEIVSGDLHRRTRSIKQNNNGPTRWDTKFSLCVFIHMVYLSH